MHPTLAQINLKHIIDVFPVQAENLMLTIKIIQQFISSYMLIALPILIIH
jgi:hypothetical protein